MKIIKHRINSISELIKVPINFGIEVDLSEFNGRIVTGHDPKENIADFQEWLSYFKHDQLAINIKQEGIEYEVIQILEKYEIRNFFLFDLSFPMIYKLSSHGEARIALRVSDLEGFQALEHFRDKVDWVWLDCFESASYIPAISKLLAGYKICAVSSELHSEREIEVSDRIQSELESNRKHFTTICTKFPERWLN